MKTSKILKSVFNNEYKNGNNSTFYHHVWFEGDERRYSIGAKTQNPDFLAAGQEIDWEFYDETKGTIKRIKKNSSAFGGKATFDFSGQMAIAAVENTTRLIVAGKIDIKDFELISKRVLALIKKLKEDGGSGK